MKQVFLFLGIIFVSFYSVYGQKDYTKEAQKRFNEANDLASKGIITAAIQKYNAAKILAENDLSLQIKIDNAIANVFNDLDNRLTIAQLDELRASIASQQASAMSNLFSLYTSYQPEIKKLAFTDSLRKSHNKQTQQSISQINTIIKGKKVTGDLQDKVELVKQIATGTSFKNKLDTLFTEIFNNSYVHQFRQQFFTGEQMYKLTKKDTDDYNITFPKSAVDTHATPKYQYYVPKYVDPSREYISWNELWQSNSPNYKLHIYIIPKDFINNSLDLIFIGNTIKIGKKNFYAVKPLIPRLEENLNETQDLLLFEQSIITNQNTTISQLFVKASNTKKELAFFPNITKYMTSPDRKWLVLQLPDHRAKLINTETFVEVEFLSNEEIDDCVFSMDSQWLICRDKVYDTSFWQLTTNEKIITPIYLGKNKNISIVYKNQKELQIKDGEYTSLLKIDTTDISLIPYWLVDSTQLNKPTQGQLIPTSSLKVQFNQHTIQIQNDKGETLQTIYHNKKFQKRKKPEYYILNNRFFFVVLGKSLIKTDLQIQRGTLFTYGDGTKFGFNLNEIEIIKDLFLPK